MTTELIISPLSQVVTRDGKQIKFEIYDDGEGGWLLESVDEHGNSMVWDNAFPTDQAALDEGMRTIADEGIDVLIGPPATGGTESAVDGVLSGDEYDELADFLERAADTVPTMDMITLEGFMSGISIGPRMLLPSQWLPWLWDMEAGKAEPGFQGKEQAGRIMSLLIRKYNGLLDAMESTSAPFTPEFGHDTSRGAQAWCAGFMLATRFDADAWSSLMLMHPSWFTPFIRLGTADGLDITNQLGDAAVWRNAVAPALLQIRSYWQQHPVTAPDAAGDAWLDDGYGNEPLVRAAPKVGRNEPCPCGSGKKFKRCCGAGRV